MARTGATVVLVHGAWMGAWCWASVTEQLDAAGVPNVALDNPSVVRAPSDLHADADNVMRAIDEIGGPVVLLGHSYGGAVVTDVGMHPNVEHIVYLTAFALDDGESVMTNELTGGEEMTLADGIELGTDTCEVRPDLRVAHFYNDCEAGAAQRAADAMRPMTLAAMGGVPRAIGWRSKPSTYVVCTDDQALPVALQQSNAKRVGTSIEIPTGHSPFVSRPELVVEVLRDLTGR